MKGQNLEKKEIVNLMIDSNRQQGLSQSLNKHNASLVKQIKELQNIRTHKRMIVEKSLSQKKLLQNKCIHNFENDTGKVIVALAQHINEARRNIKVSSSKRKRSRLY